MSDTATYEVKVKQEKVEAVREIAERLDRSSTILLTEYRGLTVPELAELRSALGDAEVEYKVVKNTLTLIAARDQGIDGLDDMLEGPTAIAFCFGDPVNAAKALTGFADDHPALVIKGAVLEGRIMTPDEAKNLATIDALEMSLAKITGTLQSAARAMLGTLEGALRQIMFVLENLPADAAAPAEEPAEAAAAPEAEAEPEETEPEAATEEAEPEVAAEEPEPAPEPEAEAASEAAAEEPEAEPEPEPPVEEPETEETTEQAETPADEEAEGSTAEGGDDETEQGA